MSENEQIQVLEALSMLPDNILKVTQGLKFQKYSEAEMDEYEKKLEKKSRKKGKCWWIL